MRSLVLLEPLSLHRLNCYFTRDSHLQSCAFLLPPCAFAFHIPSSYDAPSYFTSLLQPRSSSPSYILSFLFRNSFSFLILGFVVFLYLHPQLSTPLLTPSLPLGPHSLTSICSPLYHLYLSHSPPTLLPAPFLTHPLFSPVLSALLNRAPHYPPPASIRGS